MSSKVSLGFTITGYAARCGICYSTAAGQLARMVATGALVKGHKHLQRPDGSRCRVAWFTPR